MNPPPANLTLLRWSDPATPGKVFMVIRNGIPRTAMADWPTLSDQQVWGVVAYLSVLASP